MIYAFKEGSIRVINQSAKDTAAVRKPSAPEKPLGETLAGSLQAVQCLQGDPELTILGQNTMIFTMKYLGPDRQTMDFPVS